MSRGVQSGLPGGTSIETHDRIRNARPAAQAVLLAALTAALLSAPAPAAAQTFEGNTWETAGGAVLGLYSGSMLGLLGTMMPCNRMLQGDRCAASGTGTGGALGMVMGGLIAAQNTEAIQKRVESSGYGVVAGAVIGLALRQAVRQYDWADVGAAALIGGAMGAAPTGSLIGAGSGVVVGGLVWLLVPRSTVGHFLMFTLVGTAVGGMIDWGEGAATAKRERPPPFPLFTIRIR